MALPFSNTPISYVHKNVYHMLSVLLLMIFIVHTTMALNHNAVDGIIVPKAEPIALDFTNIYAPYKAEGQSGTVPLFARQGLRRPPNFVTWLFTGGRLVISLVFTLLESGVRDAGLLGNVLDDNGCTELTNNLRVGLVRNWLMLGLLEEHSAVLLYFNTHLTPNRPRSTGDSLKKTHF